LISIQLNNKSFKQSLLKADFMISNLKNLTVGDLGKIIGFDKSGKAYRKRLLAMGLTPGTEFSITRFAPMGDPVEIKLRGFSLTLRKDEASVLLIEKI
jgi:ferrous iron transport protein A